MTAARAYYDRYWSPGGYQPPTQIDAYLQRLFEEHVAPGARCLDVGCGDAGKSGPWMSQHAAHYIGVDISGSAIDTAREAGFDARLIEDASALPFDPGEFDVAVCIEVLEHLFEPHRAAAEIFRVLRPEGLLIATVPNAAYWRRRVELAVFGRWNPFGDNLSVIESWRDPHIRFFTRASLNRMLLGIGFEPVVVGGFGGVFLRDIPGARRLVRKNQQSRLYRGIERAVPALLSTRLYALARKRREGDS